MKYLILLLLLFLHLNCEKEKTMPKHTNHLINETSPYLLQHAHNPVDWFPWGPEAFEKAKKEDKPILLSIGYSACHWCHVMEKESFENEETAALMNQLFVNIKVDREERPDVDHRYMKFVQILTGSGGWPLTVFLTPDGEPFYGGTYFPPEDRYGKPGFKKLLQTVANFYHHNKGQLKENLEQIAQAMQKSQKKIAGSNMPSKDQWQAAVKQLSQYYDPVHGGMGRAPKFPAVQVFSLFLRYYANSFDDHYLKMVEHTLQRMAEGGIYDQLGGGFARYSVDEKWLVPHFEKMLYDNAQLINLYVDAYQLTKNPFYLKIAEETAQFVLRELTDEEGGFYSSLDADSEGEEGKFYIWSKKEIMDVLGAQKGQLFCERYGVTEHGNFEGQNILFVNKSFKQLALEFKRPEAEIEKIIEEARQTLFKVRNKRVHPGLDFKVQTSWNGLMLSALSRLYQVAPKENYARAIRKNIDFLKKHQYQNGQLLHIYSKGQSKIAGFLDDYAYLAGGLIEAYQALFDPQFLLWAKELTLEAERRFADTQDGGYFYNQVQEEESNNGQLLKERYKEESDASVPSPVAIMLDNQLKLFSFFEEENFIKKAEQLLRKYGQEAIAQPYAYASFLNALDFYLQQPLEIVLIKLKGDDRFEALRQNIFSTYLPNKIVFVAEPDNNETPIGRSLLQGREPLEGKSTVYVCKGQTCSLPVNTVDGLQQILAAAGK